jgi:hypothetical protein
MTTIERSTKIISRNTSFSSVDFVKDLKYSDILSSFKSLHLQFSNPSDRTDKIYGNSGNNINCDTKFLYDCFMKFYLK